MKEILHIYYRAQKGGQVEDPITFMSDDMEKYGYVKGGSVEVEFDLPPMPSAAEVIKSQISTLRNKQGEHQHEIDKIEEAIQQLLCIEYKPESETV